MAAQEAAEFAAVCFPAGASLLGPEMRAGSPRIDSSVACGKRILYHITNLIDFCQSRLGKFNAAPAVFHREFTPNMAR
jgi:hypothetical protein